MQTQERPNFLIFASWRLLAAFAIMLYHFFHYGPQTYVAVTDNVGHLMALLDMFFVISGFLIWIHYKDRLTSKKAYGEFLIRRLARFYPLHLITLAYFCVVALVVHSGLVSSGAAERYSLIEFFKQILLINAWGVSDSLSYNYVSWSLSAEWFCYLTFPILVVLHKRYGISGLLVLLVGTVAALEGLTAVELIPFPTWLEANTWGAYRVFADFTFGALMAEVTMRRLVKIKSHWLAWGALAFALGVMLSDPDWGYWSIFAMALALTIAAQIEFNAPNRSRYLTPLMPFASVSFGIYLWHPIIANALLGVIWRRVIEPMDIIPFSAVLTLAIIATFVIAMLSARFVEAPVRRAILNWMDKRSERAALRMQAKATRASAQEAMPRNLPLKMQDVPAE